MPKKTKGNTIKMSTGLENVSTAALILELRKRRDQETRGAKITCDCGTCKTCRTRENMRRYRERLLHKEIEAHKPKRKRAQNKPE